jgi:hypothetical protein
VALGGGLPKLESLALAARRHHEGDIVGAVGEPRRGAGTTHLLDGGGVRDAIVARAAVLLEENHAAEEARAHHILESLGVKTDLYVGPVGERPQRVFGKLPAPLLGRRRPRVRGTCRS